jgi:hypothetical protein
MHLTVFASVRIHNFCPASSHEVLNHTYNKRFCFGWCLCSLLQSTSWAWLLSADTSVVLIAFLLLCLQSCFLCFLLESSLVTYIQEVLEKVQHPARLSGGIWGSWSSPSCTCALSAGSLRSPIGTGFSKQQLFSSRMSAGSS